MRLVGCDRLKLVAPTALLPKLAERVRAAKPMLLAALAETASQVTAKKNGGGVSNPQRNGATVQHLMAESTSDRADPTPAVKWRARNRETLAYWSTFHPADEAARLAWGEIENHWHMQYGERVPHWQCAGCREPIGGLPALILCSVKNGKLSLTEALLKLDFVPCHRSNPRNNRMFVVCTQL